MEADANCILEIYQKYWVSPVPPMIVDPRAVSGLSDSALKQNLAAHAAFNTDISVEGSRSELVDRLKKILEIRRDDLLVRKLIGQKSP